MKTSYEKFMASNAVTEVTKVEMGTMKVDLAITDDIVAVLKDVKSTLDKANAADARIAKAIEVLKKEYTFYSMNKKLGTLYSKKGQDLYKKFDALAKQLGVPVKGSESEKNIGQIFDYASQIDDTLGSMQDKVASIPK
jgi:archaellum component FlaC